MADSITLGRVIGVGILFKSRLTPRRLKWLSLALIAFGLLGNVWLLGSFRSARAADCDDNAVIRCGVVNETAAQMKCVENTNNTQGIFQAFGITCDSLHGLVEGQVTSDNKVYIRNASGGLDLVGTDAITAGRQRIDAGDTPIANGSAYQRPPSESFVSSPLSALVKMDGSKFVYAVIMSCGNPVNATSVAAPPQPVPQPPKQQTPPPPPPPTPNYTIEKTDRLHVQDAWGENVVAKPDDLIQFQLLVKNTGQTALDGTVVKDTLPVGLSYVPNSVLVDGNGQNTDITTSGVTISKFASGQTVTIIFVGKAQDVDACNNAVINTGTMQPPNLSPKSDTATVQICKPSQPTPPPPPPAQTIAVTKTVLPDTGAGSTIAVFAVATLSGAVLYQLYLRKRFI